MIEYIDSLETVTPAMLDGFFVGWPDRPGNETMLKILHGSYKVWLAFDDGKCVGFVNAISDGINTAFIPLLEVLPDYKGRGIGTELMRRMDKSLSHLYATVLQCDDGVVPFYSRIGYMKGSAMYKRNFSKQGG